MNKKQERKYGVVVLHDGKESTMHLYSSLKKAESHYKKAKSEIFGLAKNTIYKSCDQNSKSSTRITFKSKKMIPMETEAHGKGIFISPSEIRRKA